MPPLDNVEMLGIVARRLGTLADSLVFLGGATTGLFITDAGAPAVRTTADVDAIVEVAGVAGYGSLGERLRSIGFKEDTDEGAPICRWVVEGVKVDVMPADSSVLGFTNRWYGPAIAGASKVEIAPGLEIKLVSPPHFLATKLDAFAGRGAGDYVGSRDMEDIIAVVDGRPGLSGEVERSEKALRDYVGVALAKFLSDTRFVEAISGHLPPDEASQARKPLILDRLRRMADLA